MTGHLPHLLLAQTWSNHPAICEGMAHLASNKTKPPAFLVFFGVSGLKRREMPTEDGEDHPLDARNSTHKEAVLSRCSNADTHQHMTCCTESTKRRAEVESCHVVFWFTALSGRCFQKAGLWIKPPGFLGLLEFQN